MYVEGFTCMYVCVYVHTHTSAIVQGGVFRSSLQLMWLQVCASGAMDEISSSVVFNSPKQQK